ncbi:hypothetical protein ASPCAL10538 [Aspergillus calidoustus]|uniref:Uncharacterized protein n=1 Tax=Aspergillus calidoustus TaxID=454130 RepID=A0A0U4ZBZ3_ASPCI|nr:hypothetical protein ASPCAL10538 [Aspergillus calidoustus]
MSVEDRSRIRSWLSQADGAETVIPHADNHPSAKFIFDGIPIAKQAVGAGHALQGSQQAAHRQQDPLDSGRLEQSNSGTRPTTRATESHQSRKEKNGYERIPRSKTKQDRYEYKGKSSRVKGESATTRRKAQSKQRRRHNINENFHASNVPTNRLTLHPVPNLGIFNKGKRSSPVKTRVLDQGFSESDFFNKSSVNEPNDQTLQQTNRLSMFDYDTRIEDPRQLNLEPRAELLGPRIEESPRVRLNSPDMGVTHGDTATYDEPEPGNPAIIDAAPGPFSQLGNQSFECEKQDILHEKTTVTSCMDDSRVVEALEKYLCSANTRAAEDSGKRYWSLEDLKHLMQQRISRWLPELKDSTSARISRPEQISLKRKHNSSENGTGILAELRKKREKVLEPAQKLDGNPAGRSTGSQVTLLGPCSVFDQPISVPAAEGFLEHRHMNHASEGRYFQPQRPCRDIRPSMTHNDGTSLISEAFDNAYEAIMRSETDVPYRLPDLPAIGDTIIGRHEDSLAAPVLQTPWMWEAQREEELNPFQFRQGFPHSDRRVPGSVPQMTQARQIIDLPLYFSDSRASQGPKLSIELEPASEPGQALGRERLEVNHHDFDSGPLKDFWLSSKLY